MPQLCLYFHLHQPLRLREYSVFDIGAGNEYFSSASFDDNRAVFEKVSAKSYRPMLQLLRHLLETQPKFTFALSITGTFIEQAAAYDPVVLDLLASLMQTGRVEVLSETYHHSLASLYSGAEFFRQVAMHTHLLDELFGITPTTFRNTELVYSNAIGDLVSKLGFKGVLTEGVGRYLHGRSITQVFKATTKKPLAILLKHAVLSDDIAFRFSDRSWPGYPLSVDTYLEWIQVYGEQELINLFMDFETFGEHQWADTGIFEFFAAFVDSFLASDWNACVTPAQVIAATLAEQPTLSQAPVYDVPEPISWADVDRDLTAWVDNSYQRDCLRVVYQLEDQILASKDETLISDWRKLQTSDHFYYMCTKWSADGDVHAYFSPYDTPHEAYRRYSIVLADVKNRLLRLHQ